MPGIALVTAFDAEPTPIQHTFLPDGIRHDPDIAFWRNAGAGPTAVHHEKLSLSWSVTSAGKQKARMKFEVPVVADEVINGVSTPRVVRRAIFDGTVTFDLTSTQQERDNFIEMLTTLMQRDQLLDTMKDGEALW